MKFIKDTKQFLKYHARIVIVSGKTCLNYGFGSVLNLIYNMLVSYVTTFGLKFQFVEWNWSFGREKISLNCGLDNRHILEQYNRRARNKSKSELYLNTIYIHWSIRIDVLVNTVIKTILNIIII